MALKSGYTTGTCAVLATLGAIKMLFNQKPVASEQVMTPKGVLIKADILQAEYNSEYATCAIKKYSGDDPDITNGMLIYSTVSYNTKGEINIDGAEGIGRVTALGLDQPIGAAAINSVPRRLIRENARALLEEYGYEGGVNIIISAPGGEEIAQKTFNPRLGIKGGISILGTSGIVEPMSEQALIDTIRVELNVKKANNHNYIMLSPGNYGIDFIKSNFNMDLDKAVKISNFVGEGLDMAAELGFKGVLLIGHVGKLCKLSLGIMNTHSKNADGRLEALAIATLKVSDDLDLIRKITACRVTDEALELLKDKGLLEAVMSIVTQRAAFYLDERLKGSLEIGLIIFSNAYGLLGKTENVDGLIKNIG